MEFIPVAKPQTESELVVMASLLEANDIPHFVHNRGFGGLYPGIQIDLYNERRIMVPEDRADEAIDLLSIFAQHSTESNTEEKLTARDKLRVIAETLLFWWAFPRKRRKPSKENDA